MKHIDRCTKIRTIVLLIALVNQMLTVMGFSPIPLDEAMINEVVIQIDLLISTLFTIGASLVAWWKDNDVTKETVEKKKKLDLK